jgi:hypothetical protein
MAGSPAEDKPAARKGADQAGVRKMIAQLHEELGVYEGTREMDGARTEPNRT